MDTQYYIDEGIKQLSNTYFYEEVPLDLSGEVIHRINLYVHDCAERMRLLARQQLFKPLILTGLSNFICCHKSIRMLCSPQEDPVVSGLVDVQRKYSSLWIFYQSISTKIQELYWGLHPYYQYIFNGITNLPPNAILCT